MKKTLLIVGIVFIGVIVLVIALLPSILKAVGWHPDYVSETYDFSGKKALVIATNHDTLGDTGQATGVYHSSLTSLIMNSWMPA